MYKEREQNYKWYNIEDDSSVSSEISETCPELTNEGKLIGSSGSTNVYGNLKRSTLDAPTYNSSGYKTSGPSADRSRKVTVEYASNITNSSSSGGKTKQVHVKKTDSSMQTESSAFQQISSSWKKYHMLQQQQQQVANTYETPINRSSPADKLKDKRSQRSESSKKSTDSHRTSKQHKLSSRPGPDPELSRSLKAGSCESLTSGSGRKVLSRPSVVQTASQQQTVTSAIKRQNAPIQYYGYNGVPLSTPPSNSKISGSGTQRSGNNIINKNSTDKFIETAEQKDGELSVTAAQCSLRSPHGSQTTANMVASNLKSIVDQQRKGKVKVCANTQTNSCDLTGVHSDGEYSSLGRKYPPKQYFMTTPGPGTGLKERIYGTRSVLNGSPTPMSDYAVLSARTSRLSAPFKDLDNYASLEHGSVGSYTWMRHSPSYGTSVNSSGISNKTGTLTEADSMESLSSTSSSVHAQIQHARANSLTHARLMLHQRELASSPRLSRSNSIRSTKSEKLPSYLLQRSSDDPEVTYATSNYQEPLNNDTINNQNGSQPTSPNVASQVGGRYIHPQSPGNPLLPVSTSILANSRCSTSYATGLPKMNNKDDEIHGSALSLVSTSSSIYSTAEEKQAHEIRKLKRELDQAHEKVTTLTSQLTTNAHMVAAFEQSLSNMTSRLQHLTATAEQKDSELMELRKTIEALKKQSAEAGLTKMALQSMQAVQRSTGAPNLVRRHTFNTTKDTGETSKQQLTVNVLHDLLLCCCMSACML